MSQERRLWPSIVHSFDLPETYPLNGVPTSIVQILGQYYKAILLPFEDWNRKSAQQRSMLSMQGQAGQSLPVGQHGMPGQMPGGELTTQGVMPPTVPHLDGGSALAPHHPFASSSSQTHRQQPPSAGLTVLPSRTSLHSPDLLSGMGSNLSQTSPSDGSQLGVHHGHGQAQDGATATFDPDPEGRKRKGTAEADAKRVRQRTGDVPAVHLSRKW